MLFFFLALSRSENACTDTPRRFRCCCWRFTGSGDFNQESGGMILSVTTRSLYALVSHLCLTGLPEVAMPYSDMWQDCQITFPHPRPCYAKSIYRLVDSQTLHGNVHQVDHVPNGPTNSAAITTMFPLRLCGGKPLVAVTRERRYSPSRLRVNDDDDDADFDGLQLDNGST